MVTAELVILLFISMWQKKRRDKGSDSPRDSTAIELTESNEEEDMPATLDQMVVVDSEIDAET